MASVGPVFPGTAVADAADAGTGEDDDAWVNPGNVSADDASEAQITAASYDSPDISRRLRATNFDFSSIPSGSTIDGITVEIDRRSIVANSGRDFRVQLVDSAGAIVGTNKANTGANWPSSSTTASYGGAADTWTASPTQAMVTNSNFGVVLSCQAQIANADVGVDFIRMTINYTAPVVVATVVMPPMRAA